MALSATPYSGGELISLTKELDHYKNTQRSLDLTLKRKENEIRDLKEERLLLEELHTINQMMARKQESGAHQMRNVRALIPQETFDKIVRLDNLIKHHRTQREQYYGQHELLVQQCRVKEEALVEVRSKTDNLKTMVSWDARVIKSKDDYIDMENKLIELKKKITALQEEQNATRVVTQSKTKAIEELALTLESLKDVENDIFNAQTTLKIKERELEEIKEDIKTLDRIALKKDRMLHNMRERDDQKKVRDLETRKNILRHEIAKSLEQRRANERSLLAQQTRIEAMENKLRVVIQVIQKRKNGTALTPEEHAIFRPGLEKDDVTVPVELFDQAHKELLDTRATLEARDAQLTELDAEVENIESKVAVLARAKACAAKRHLLLQRDQEMETAQLEAFMQIRNDAYQSQLEHLTSENEKLEHFLKKVKATSESRSA